MNLYLRGMRTILAFATLFLLAACSSTPLQKQFNEANKVKVLIYSGSERPSVHYETNDVERIKSFYGFINDTAVASASCDYEGRLVLYFTETDTNEMRFSLASGCRQITYRQDDEQFTKPLTDEGIAYFESLKQIR